MEEKIYDPLRKIKFCSSKRCLSLFRLFNRSKDEMIMNNKRGIVPVFQTAVLFSFGHYYQLFLLLFHFQSVEEIFVILGGKTLNFIGFHPDSFMFSLHFLLPAAVSKPSSQLNDLVYCKLQRKRHLAFPQLVNSIKQRVTFISRFYLHFCPNHSTDWFGAYVDRFQHSRCVLGILWGIFLM